MKINKELLKGSTVIMILTMLNRRAMYGYEMIKEMEQQSGGIFSLKEGTLYPILHSLEAESWLEAYWSEHDGRKRKYYRITDKGGTQLQDKKQEWVVFRTALDRMIGEGGA